MKKSSKKKSTKTPTKKKPATTTTKQPVEKKPSSTATNKSKPNEKENTNKENTGNKENEAIVEQKVEASSSSKLNKTLPPEPTENKLPPKRTERMSMFEPASHKLPSKSPLGGIDLKTPTQQSLLRLGLSRNSRPKPLHPNAKPIN